MSRTLWYQTLLKIITLLKTYSIRKLQKKTFVRYWTLHTKFPLELYTFQIIVAVHCHFWASLALKILIEVYSSKPCPPPRRERKLLLSGKGWFKLCKSSILYGALRGIFQKTNASKSIMSLDVLGVTLSLPQKFPSDGGYVPFGTSLGCWGSTSQYIPPLGNTSLALVDHICWLGCCFNKNLDTSLILWSRSTMPFKC